MGIRRAGWSPVVYPIRFDKRSPYQLSASPILGYEFKPNFRDPESRGDQNYPYINADGFREVERRRIKLPGVKRIIMLGDSVVAGPASANSIKPYPVSLNDRSN